MNLSLNLNPFFAKKVNPFSKKSELILQNEPIRILYPFRRLLTKKRKQTLCLLSFFVRIGIFEFVRATGGARGTCATTRGEREREC